MTDEDLKNKYQPVADFMSRNGFQIQHFHVENGKAVLTASAPTEYLKNRAWDEIKKSRSQLYGLATRYHGRIRNHVCREVRRQPLQYQ